MPELFDKLTFKHIYFRGDTFTSDNAKAAALCAPQTLCASTPCVRLYLEFLQAWNPTKCGRHT